MEEGEGADSNGEMGEIGTDPNKLKRKATDTRASEEGEDVEAEEEAYGTTDKGKARAPNADPGEQHQPAADEPTTATKKPYDETEFLPSSSDWNPTDTPSCPSRLPTPDSPTLIARVRTISTAFYYEPDPPRTALWYCPVRTCYYCIDLIELTDEQKSFLGEELTARFLSLKWRNGDDWVKDACKTLSRAHYAEHMKSVGVRMWWDKWKRVSS